MLSGHDFSSYGNTYLQPKSANIEVSSGYVAYKKHV